MSKRRFIPDQSEIDEWKQFVSDVVPHSHIKTIEPEINTKKVHVASQEVSQQISFNIPCNQSDLQVDEKVGIKYKTIKEIDKGKYQLDGIIDLHGCTKDDACNSLEQFIMSAARRKLRLLLVITGKGQVLRSSLLDWLNSKKLRPFILRVSTASKNRGGKGAFHVFLKQIK